MNRESSPWAERAVPTGLSGLHVSSRSSECVWSLVNMKVAQRHPVSPGSLWPDPPSPPEVGPVKRQEDSVFTGDPVVMWIILDFSTQLLI